MVDQILSRDITGIDIVDQYPSELIPWDIPVDKDGRDTYARSMRERILTTQTGSHDQAFHIISNHGFDQAGKLLGILF